MPISKKATIRDVAERAGVSHQTVSRVINLEKGVTDETRQRVLAVIAEMDYRPHAIARIMAKGSTCTFAVIAPNLTDFTFASLIDGAATHARQNGYFVTSASAPDPETFARLVEELVSSRRTDGLLVINPYADERHKYLPKDVPIVLMGARPRSQSLASVALDDFQGGYLAAQHLFSLGHRDIVVLSGPLEEDCTQDRLEGFRKAASEAGKALDESYIHPGDWSATSGVQAVDHFLASGKPFSAICAQNDRMAVGAIHQLRQRGLRVPEQVSVIGFDDMPLASYFDPPLTTIRQDILAIGREAAALLIAVIEGKVPTSRHQLFQAELVLRASTAPARN